MAENSFKISLVTPQGKLLDGSATYASIPAHDGQMGFAPGRAPIVMKLGLGTMSVRFAVDAKGGGGERSYLVEDGFAQMVNGKLTVLTTRAIPAEELEVAQAEAELRSVEGKGATRPEDTQRLTRDKDRARLKVRMARERSGKGI